MAFADYVDNLFWSLKCDSRKRSICYTCICQRSIVRGEHGCFYKYIFSYRIVRNRASDNARSNKDGGSPVSEGVTPHGSPGGQGAYTIQAIMGLPGTTPPLTDHNGNTGTKRKIDDTGNDGQYFNVNLFFSLFVSKIYVVWLCLLHRRLLY